MDYDMKTFDEIYQMFSSVHCSDLEIDVLDDMTDWLAAKINDGSSKYTPNDYLKVVSDFWDERLA